MTAERQRNHARVRRHTGRSGPAAGIHGSPQAQPAPSSRAPSHTPARATVTPPPRPPPSAASSPAPTREVATGAHRAVGSAVGNEDVEVDARRIEYALLESYARIGAHTSIGPCMKSSMPMRFLGAMLGCVVVAMR